MTGTVSVPYTFGALTSSSTANLDSNFTALVNYANDPTNRENNGPDTGTANTYVVVTSPPISTAPTIPLGVSFLPANTNTGASTIAVGALSAVSLVKIAGSASSALAANDIVAGIPANIVYWPANSVWVLLNPASAGALVANASPTGFSNLKIVGAATSTTITLTADEMVMQNSSGATVKQLSLSQTITTSVSGAGGLDTGSIAASTWYAVFSISNGSTTSSLMSLSGTAPTMPSGYTYKKRCGWVRTNASSTQIGTIQYGRRAQYIATSSVTLPIMISGVSGSYSTPTFTAVSVVNYVPTTAGVIRLVPQSVGSASAGQGLIVAPNPNFAAGGNPASNTAPFSGLETATIHASPIEMVLESTNVYYASNNSGSSLQAFGWEDNI